MPELPEVEVVRKQLKKIVIGKKIENIIGYHKTIFNEDINDVREKLIGKTYLDVERYGKYLVFIFDDYVLISHLRMEGKYHIKNHHDKKEKHEHVFFELDDNVSLRYNDTRKFGRMDLRTKDDYLNVPPLSNLGFEPSKMPLDKLYSLINHRNIAIKTAILNQHIIAGIGNIYADETLFLSQIHPTRRTNTITKKEARLIVESARSVLDKAIKLGGTTIRSYTSSEGVSGRFQNELLVHTKEHEPCPVCSNIIVKMKVGGRGTYVCESCQK